MKIAFILPNYCLIDGNAGGVHIQATQWANYIRSCGHEVVEISVWGNYNWSSFDIIQFFYFGFTYLPLYEAIKAKAPNAKFICAPILDPHKPIWVYRLLSLIAIPQIKLWTEFSILRRYKNIFECFLARTEFEATYLTKSFGIPREKIKIITLNSRFLSSNVNNPKENFCLHVSRICDPTKNVERLVEAALRYNFNLVLAGSSSIEFDNKIKKKIGSRSNITLLGRISDEELKNLYSRAKVFALPSFREGVGYAALEAASYGCDIVITAIGGPKEYFLPYAIAVNPNSINDIGLSIKKFLDGKTFQPQLSAHIAKNSSKENTVKLLTTVYQGLL